MTISSHLPDLVDQYISVRAQRLALDAQVKDVKEQEDDLKNVIIAKFRAEGLKALGASNGTVKMTSSDEPIPADWTALYANIQETGRFEFLHKRISTIAIKEHADEGDYIPGIGWTKVYKLSVLK